MSEIFELPLSVFGESGELQGQVLPLPDDISYYILEKDRKIYLDYNVSSDIMALQRMILRWNMEDAIDGIPIGERKPIRIYIMSYGGDMDYMWSMVDAIETSVTPVYTINMGTAGSAAAVIFMAGHKRFAMPRSRIIIHEGSASMSGDSTKVLNASDSYRKAIKHMKQFILSKTQIPPATLNKKRNDDWELDAETCLKYHICDSIVHSLVEII